MKNYNRRDFLKLTGMSALALTLAACSDGPSAPAAPAVPAKDAQALYAAIAASRQKKCLRSFLYDSDLEAYAKLNAEYFEDIGKAKVTNEEFNDWSNEPEHDKKWNDTVSAMRANGLKVTQIKYYGIADPENDMRLTTLYPETEGALKTQMETMAEAFKDDVQYYIGISLVKVEGKTYWIAMLATK